MRIDQVKRCALQAAALKPKDTQARWNSNENPTIKPYGGNHLQVLAAANSAILNNAKRQALQAATLKPEDTQARLPVKENRPIHSNSRCELRVLAAVNSAKATGEGRMTTR